MYVLLEFIKIAILYQLLYPEHPIVEIYSNNSVTLYIIFKLLYTSQEHIHRVVHNECTSEFATLPGWSSSQGLPYLSLLTPETEKNTAYKTRQILYEKRAKETVTVERHNTAWFKQKMEDMKPIKNRKAG